MLMTYPVRPDKIDEIPAPTHVDGTGRLQTVRRDQNPRYHGLIEAFRGTDRRAGPAEHVVQRERADLLHARGGVETFRRTKMDVLVLGDFFVEKG